MSANGLRICGGDDASKTPVTLECINNNLETLLYHPLHGIQNMRDASKTIRTGEDMGVLYPTTARPAGAFFCRTQTNAPLRKFVDVEVRVSVTTLFIPLLYVKLRANTMLGHGTFAHEFCRKNSDSLPSFLRQ